MINDQLIDMLVSDSVETRKQAVKRLAQSKNREALPYLADVYQNDSDPEVRELARKGGVYIKRNAPEAASPVRAAQSLYDDDDEEEVAPTSAPLPSEIHVTKAQMEKAQAYIQQVLDLHMRGDNEKASQMLNRALRTNPRLMHDSYAISLAATVTGMPGPTAIQMLSPSGEELQKRKATATGGGGSIHRATGLQAAMAFAVMIAATVVLVGYLLFPWFDMSDVPTDEGITLGESFEEIRSQLDEDNSPEELALFLDQEEGRAMYNALKGITVEISGLDTALVSIGARDILDVMGLTRLLEVTFGGLFSEELDTTSGVEPGLLDYTLLFIPIGGLLSIGLAIFLLMRSSIMNWVLLIVVGLLTIVPYLYYYTEMVNEVLPSDGELGITSLSNDISGSTLIGIGFWVSLVGALLIIILAFVALIAMPTKQPATAAQRL